MRFLRILFYGSLVLLALIVIFISQNKDRIAATPPEVVPEADTVATPLLQPLLQPSAFHSVDLRGDFEVRLYQADSTALHIREAGVRPEDIDMEVKDSVLYLSARQADLWKRHNHIEVDVYSPAFRRIHTSGNAEIETPDTLYVDRLELHISGASECDLVLVSRSLHVKLSGAGDVELAGRSQDVDIDVSGAGNIEAFDLMAAELRVSMSGAGNAEVSARDLLSASISGAGHIVYRGRPTVVQKRVSGLGVIEAE
ncbi:MAG: hypothetical protein OHK0039_48480 [Bacteroidia bacterium]